ncbi:MAG TPA: methionine--tRNA ligase [Candidatus Paceibacterota bacterium]|nr:methionine--tRNA ligase [Candidatus Paceibacterota bacterium]
MEDKKPFYLTTTIPYVNAAPHIGFALEIVQADTIARYKRLMGHEVFFNFGSDEHGQKIYQKAMENNQTPQAYVDEYAAKFADLKSRLNLSYDTFTRTTSGTHKAAAQEMWVRCAAQNDIYKKKYKGLYCVGDEAFIKESDLVDGKCLNHPNLTPIEIEEENYFFRLSKYQDYILSYLSRDDVVIPEWRRQEAINFVRNGLEDFSISRVKEKMSWGVPVPDDDSQVMYVWFDALVNYISALGWPHDSEGNFKKFWQEGDTLQLAGKDQVRFQSVMWQGMLKSVGLKATDHVFYHGFITSSGQKMSKSLGNVIEPLHLVDEYGTDALRYFLLRHIHPTEDSDFTMERFKDAYNADLANGLGNLVARIMQLAQNNLEQGKRPEPRGFPSVYIEALDTYRYNDALAFVWDEIQFLDRTITESAPFKVVKTDPKAGAELILKLTQDLYHIAQLLTPFMPETAEKIKAAVIENKKPENLFLRKD